LKESINHNGEGGLQMSEVQTAKCPICGEPYKVYPFCDGDQSACPDCRAKAEEKEPKMSWKKQ